MSRPRPSVVALRAVSLTILAVIGCSSGPEKAILNQFFTAARLRDNTSLQNLATVSFEPRTRGTIITYEITGVSAEQHKPLDIQARAKAYELASESSIVSLSVDDQRNPIDLTKYDVDLVSKEVTITAPVKLPSGETASKTLVITMQRAVLKGERERTGRWIITAVKDTAVPAGTKTS